MMISKQRCTWFTAFAGAMIVCGVTAFAQSSTGGMQQPGGAGQSSPGGMQSGASQAPGTAPGSQNQPAMSPMNQNDMSSMSNGQTSAADKTFVMKAMQGGLAEIQLGQLALQKSNNDQVKQFAQKMIDDHGKLNDQMKPIAQQIGVPVPDSPSAKDKATMMKLQALNGDAFDKAYVKDMVKDHKTDLNEFKAEAQKGSNPSVKDAANQGSQVISQHLTMIQQIAQKNGSGSTASSGGGNM